MEFAVVGTLALSGLLSAVSVYIVLLCLDIRRVVGYHLVVDVTFSVLLVVVYAGTFSGMITAFAGGLSLSLMLLLTKLLIGYAQYYKADGEDKWRWHYFAGWIA
jgi:hypothetical protein